MASDDIKWGRINDSAASLCSLGYLLYFYVTKNFNYEFFV